MGFKGEGQQPPLALAVAGAPEGRNYEPMSGGCPPPPPQPQPVLEEDSNPRRKWFGWLESKGGVWGANTPLGEGGFGGLTPAHFQQGLGVLFAPRPSPSSDPILC